jgi:DNA-binding MarR family transcriptional regulator/response regulator of citrate/malate metabolism
MSSFIQDDEELRFADETEPIQPDQSWKILIVDDDAEVHTITRLALRDVVFEGRSLSFLSAYSAQEARQLIQAHPDTAIIFLDVVMETDDAGLHLVQYVREALGNALVRIILRTGQPGQAPEDVVALNYGIDDYKTKTELTAQKLMISVVTALRAFSTLMALLDMSRGLETEIIQHKQSEISLRVSEMTAIAKVRQLEQSLQSLRQAQQPFVPRDKVAPLNQLVAETAHAIIQLPGEMDVLQTMSIVTRIARTVLRITDDHAAKLGISQTKLAVLMDLSRESECGASPSELAKHCGVSRAAMTGLLDGLENDGYVERVSHPSDRRALTIELTSKGQQFLDLIAPQNPYRLSELMAALSEPEREKLQELAMKITYLFAES